MSIQKRKKSFFKIKEKLVFVQTPKKFFGFRIAGAFIFLLGFILIVLSLVYWFFLPRFYQDKPVKVIEVPVEKKVEFIPERVIFPSLNLDFSIKTGTVEGKLLTKTQNIKEDEEMIVLGLNNLYKKYLISEINLQEGSSSGSFKVDKTEFDLVIPVRVKPQKELLIKANLSAE